MKLVFYTTNGTGHIKNWEGIQRMCTTKNIEFEYTNSIERLKVDNYNLLYCIQNYVDPDIIPNSIKIIYGPQFWVIPQAPIVGKYRYELEVKCVFNSFFWVEDL